MVQIPLKIGRFFYGVGIMAIGVHQIITRHFRPDVLPAFPLWIHSSIKMAYVVAAMLMVAGFIIGLGINTKTISAKNISLGLAVCFLVIIVMFHLPFIMFVSSANLLDLQTWFGVGEALAYCGGAMVMARSFSQSNYNNSNIGKLEALLMPIGTTLYAILIIIFGFSHFVYPDYVKTMVPAYLGVPLFWTYAVGALLIAAGIALMFRIWLKNVAWLLAIMILLFFLLFHVPDAIANPTVDGGNEIIRAFVALLFTGIALVIAVESEK